MTKKVSGRESSPCAVFAANVMDDVRDKHLEAKAQNSEEKSSTAPVEEAATASKPKGKPKDDRFRYGNYNRYYGTRTKGFERDPRLELLPGDWFLNRGVLDIGCNVGALTLTIAKEFQPMRVLGIDIDTNLIGIARKNIRHYCDEKEELIGKFPASIVSNSSAGESSSTVEVNKFPKNVWFQAENYVLESDFLLEMVQPEYDVILALSITKWVHLNWGDEGIKRFFRRAFRQLRPGGRFILEPQDFATYGRRSKLNEEMRETFRKIAFKPDQFEEYLLSAEVGFCQVHRLGVPQAKSKGFERPIFVFIKAIPPPRIRAPKRKCVEGDQSEPPATAPQIKNFKDL